MASNGTIDQLNFKVVLNDKEFTAKIDKDIAKAKQLNDQITKLLSSQKKLDADTTKQLVNQQKVEKAAAKTALEQEKVRTQMEKTAEAAKRTAEAEQRVKTEAEKTRLAHEKTQKYIEKTANSLGGGGNSLLRGWLRFSATLWSIVSVVRIFTRTLGSWIKKISEFQQANANLATIMQVSRREVSALTEDALMLGRTTEWTASQVTELQTALAKLGYNIPQIKNMQASVLQFATAVSANLPDAANLAGAALRMFGLQSTEMQKTLEILTASTNKTALDFEKLKVSLPYVGAIAHTIGFDISDTASLLGVLANSGLAASRTGTGLRQVLLRLSKENSALQEAMGGNIKTFDDFVNGLQRLRDRSIDVGEAQKLVGDRAGAALLILANGVDDVRRLNNEMRDTDGLLKDIQAERLDTLHGSTLLLKSAWEGLIQTFRESAGPMKDIVDWLTKIVNATSLAASRANRVAQGTKDVIGSDTLTKKYEDQFESLLKSGKTPQEAAEIVQHAMNMWLDAAYENLSDLQNKGYSESGFKNALYKFPITHFLVSGKMNKGRAANEQVEAMENAMDAVTSYMTSRVGEEATVAANEYLERFKAIFNAEGKKAAEDAMKGLTEEMKKKGVDVAKVESDLAAYIANGGEGDGTPQGGSGETAAEKARKERISDLKNEAQSIRKLADAYEELSQYLDKEGVVEKMTEIFGEDEYSPESFDKQITDIVADLRKLGDEGNEAADSIELAFGRDKLSMVTKQLKQDKKAAEDAKKAMDKYNDTLRKWMGEDFGISGTGFESDATKILTDFNTKVSKVQEKYINAVEEAEEAHKGNADAIEDEKKKLGELRDAEIEYNRILAQGKIDKLAESYLKEQYTLRSVSLENLGGATLGQLKNYRKELNEIAKSMKDGTPEMEALAKKAEEAGLSFETLKDSIKSAIEKGLKNLDEQEKKSIAKLAKMAAKEVLGLADAFGELGKAIGNAKMESAAESLNAIGEFASSVSQGFSQGGIFGAAFAVMTTSIKGIIGDMAEDAKKAAEATEMMNDALRSYTKELEKAAVAAQSTIFGVNTFGQLREHIKILKKYGDYLEDVRKGYTSNSETMALAKAAGFIDDDGNLILEKISAAIDAGLLDGDTAENLKMAIEAYKEASEAIDSISESIVGDVAADAAEKIVDSWWEAGQAALDYADILEDVAKGYAKLIVQDMLLDAAFDEQRQEAFKNALKNGDAATAMSVVEQAMQSAQDMMPVIEQALQAFEPYRTMSGGEGSSLGSGVKSISEETANLLASYINAIRADVSYMRGIQEKGWEGVNAFIPTLNDHIAQISATNFDIAQSNQSILSELRSVIGAPGTSGMVVRVESY